MLLWVHLSEKGDSAGSISMRSWVKYNRPQFSMACMIAWMIGAARTDENKLGASSGASERAPSNVQQSMM